MGFKKSSIPRSMIDPECLAKMDAEEAARKNGKKAKYSNKKVDLDGKTFHSKREAARYQALKVILQAGAIADLETQTPFRIEINGVKICKYYADFTYTETDTGKKVVEDCKGYRTPEYVLKKKLMRAVFGIEIKET